MLCTLKSSYLLRLLTSPNKGWAGDAFLPLPQLGRPKILFPMLLFSAKEKKNSRLPLHVATAAAFRGRRLCKAMQEKVGRKEDRECCAVEDVGWLHLWLKTLTSSVLLWTHCSWLYGESTPALNFSITLCSAPQCAASLKKRGLEWAHVEANPSSISNASMFQLLVKENIRYHCPCNATISWTCENARTSQN